MKNETQTGITARRWSWFSFLVGIGVATCVFALSSPWRKNVAQRPPLRVPIETERDRGSSPGTAEASSVDEVLRIAKDALDHIRLNVVDYTATMVQQETVGGVLGVPTHIALKIKQPTTIPSPDGGQGEFRTMRVYLRFLEPASVAGREVIWAQDLYDAQLVAHEGGWMGVMTLRLDPTGMLAMRGQKYPIYDIGLEKLIVKLIERGSRDLGNPDVSVTIDRNLELDGNACQLVVVKRSRPSGEADDFSRAEICFDVARKLPLRYTSYGWPDDAGNVQVIESYTYLNIQTNVGLADKDFDPDNPEYAYP